MKKVEILLVATIIFGLLMPACVNDEYYKQGMLFYGHKQYKKSIGRFEIQLEYTPEGSLAQMCKSMIKKCYKEWIREEIKFKRYENALELMKVLLEKYPDSPEAKWVSGQEPKVRYEAAVELIKEGVIPEGARRLHELINLYPNNPISDDAQEVIENTGIITFVLDSDVWLSQADGSNARKVVENGIHPDISSDGKYIAYIRPLKRGDTKGQLYRVRIDGTKRKRLLKSPIAFRPKWSFDSKKIAVSKEDFFQIYNVETGRVKTIRPKELGYGGVFESFGDWSKDGKTYICYNKEMLDGVCKICRMDNKFSKAFLLIDDKSIIRDLDWSCDDLLIAYSTEKGLYLTDTKGGGKTILIDREQDGLDVYSLAWAPTNKSILFVAKNQEGKFGLYIVSKGGPNKKRVTLPVKISGVEEEKIQPLGCSWVAGKLPS